jgi:hypothetical protein
LRSGKDERMERAGDYLNQSLKYLENALKASKDGDPEKLENFCGEAWLPPSRPL